MSIVYTLPDVRHILYIYSYTYSYSYTPPSLYTSLTPLSIYAYTYTGEYPPVSMREVSRHFPPVVHRWSCTQSEAAALIPPALVTPPLPNEPMYTFPISTTILTDPSPTSSSESELITTNNHHSSTHNAHTLNTIATLPTPKIFTHELLQGFSFHLFAKRPIEPITSISTLRREIMRRMALSALQIRFNVQQRQDPLFTFVDFNQLNWPREG